MKISPDRDVVIKYIGADSYDDIMSMEPDVELLKQIKKNIDGKLAHNIYIMLRFAEFKVGTKGLLDFNDEIQKEGIRLQQELTRFGDIMTLLPRDIQDISFTIKGRKIGTTYPQLKMELAKCLREIQNRKFSSPQKRKTKPAKFETFFVKSLIPLAKFLKHEHAFIDADIYRNIQDLLFIKGYDVDLDFIRQRLQSDI